MGIHYVNFNINGKIWTFVQEHIQVGVIFDSEQQLTLQLTMVDGKEIIIIMVYAKCSSLERLRLWDDIYVLWQSTSMPWLMDGDFNAILGMEEKIGGLPIYPQEYEDFVFFINSCDLFYIDFTRSPFTWWNDRVDEKCIFKRLDKFVIN